MSDFLTLKKANSKNCYKCIRHCPVKSIRFSGNQAHIIGNECILCGQCFVVCPQNAKQIVDGTENARVLLQSGDPVYASIAPSFIANYPGVGIKGMEKALRQLGFASVWSALIGAEACSPRSCCGLPVFCALPEPSRPMSPKMRPPPFWTHCFIP